MYNNEEEIMQEILNFAKKFAPTANDREVINLQKKHNNSEVIDALMSKVNSDVV